MTKTMMRVMVAVTVVRTVSHQAGKPRRRPENNHSRVMNAAVRPKEACAVMSPTRWMNRLLQWRSRPPGTCRGDVDRGGS